MRALSDGLSSLIIRRPLLVVLGTVVLTLVFGAFAGQSVTDDGVAVDNDLSAALEVIDETFGDPRAVAQVVVESTDGQDVRSAEGLRLSLAIQEAIRSGPLADTLIPEGQRPPIFQATDGLDDEATNELQRELAEVVDQVETPEGLQVETFLVRAAVVGHRHRPGDRSVVRNRVADHPAGARHRLLGQAGGGAAGPDRATHGGRHRADPRGDRARRRVDAGDRRGARPRRRGADRVLLAADPDRAHPDHRSGRRLRHPPARPLPHRGG